MNRSCFKRDRSVASRRDWPRDMMDFNRVNSCLIDTEALFPMPAASLCTQIDTLRSSELFHAVSEKKRETRLSIMYVFVNCAGVKCR